MPKEPISTAVEVARIPPGSMVAVVTPPPHLVNGTHVSGVAHPTGTGVHHTPLF